MKRRNLLGILIIAIGIIILLGRLDIIESDNIFSTYWPIIIIAIGLVNLFDKYGSKTLATILIIVGVVFQLKELELEILEDVPIGEFIFPAIVIIVGLYFIIPKKKGSRKKISSLDSLDSICLFSGYDIVNDSRNFQGGNLVTAFGGIDIDLTHANISESKPVIIDTFVAFGGIDIKVPNDWKVEIKGLPLFGGWENETKRDIDTNKVLVIKCVIMFGGLDVNY
ncbi:hypothetical protein SH1V18_31370 [Vallitalea longa]|uniref:LiaF transmembrane domain-containing protein n=1 Tax=Vallitalea longa TaxID=2936439 RepID=A0A9W5YBY0_9FIRM|nr:DUF5668 domain-containing protein [Vallitalea longa]GKX30657.1 hypothetical protein SH1V18_31370 [Vallitalea longa]